MTPEGWHESVSSLWPQVSDAYGCFYGLEVGSTNKK